MLGEKVIRFLCLILVCLVFLGCAEAGYGPNGLLLTNTQLGVYADGEKSYRTGRSCVESVLGLVAWGNASLQTAKAQGQVKVVHSIDYECKSALGIYSSLCVVIKGD